MDLEHCDVLISGKNKDPWILQPVLGRSSQQVFWTSITHGKIDDMMLDSQSLMHMKLKHIGAATYITHVFSYSGSRVLTIAHHHTNLPRHRNRYSGSFVYSEKTKSNVTKQLKWMWVKEHFYSTIQPSCPLSQKHRPVCQGYQSAWM